MAKKPTTKPVSDTTTKDSAPEVVVANTVLKLIIPAVTTKRAYQQALEKAARKAKTAGFRQGKVPLPMVEDMVGAESLVGQALDQVVPAAYQRLIQAENKSPLTDPELKLVSAKKGEDWEISVEIAEKPTVKLGSYEKVIKEAREEVKKEIEKAAKEKPKSESKDDHEGHDHDHDHADHDHSHDGHTHGNEMKDDDKILQGIFRKLLENIMVPIPELLLKTETRQQLDGLVRQLDQMKLKLEDYLKHQGQTFEELTGQVAAGALANLQLEFILEAIGEDQKIEVSDEEVKAELALQAKAKAVQPENPYIESYIKRTLHRRKLLSFLLDQR